MRERARGYADGALDGLNDKALREAAAQLEDFSALVAGSQDLRAAFALPTTAALVRRAIVLDLLQRKASTATAKLLAFAAQVGPGADFPDDVAELALVAGRRAAGAEVAGEQTLGRVAARERVAGYASAVLSSLKDESRLGNIEDELFRFMRIVDGNDELRVALTTSELPTAARRGVVADLLARRAAPETARLATYAVVVGRPRDYPELLAALVDQVAAEARRRVADVRSAVDMSEAQRKRLATALARLTGTPVDVRVTLEPGLVGGFVATVGDTVVDASLRHRLAQARDLLASPATGPATGSDN